MNRNFFTVNKKNKLIQTKNTTYNLIILNKSDKKLVRFLINKKNGRHGIICLNKMSILKIRNFNKQRKNKCLWKMETFVIASNRKLVTNQTKMIRKRVYRFIYSKMKKLLCIKKQSNQLQTCSEHEAFNYGIDVRFKLVKVKSISTLIQQQFN